MKPKRDQTRTDQFSLLFLYPLVYRPLKPNFARKFELLSDKCHGNIVAVSSGRNRNISLSNFLFHSEVRQAFLPLVALNLVWRGFRPDAIIAYDPYGSGFAGMILKLLFRTKLIVEVNGDYHQDLEKLQPSRKYYEKLMKRVIFHFSVRFADAIKVLNSNQAQHFQRIVPKKKIYRFQDFVASDYFQSLVSFQGNYLLSVGHPFYLKGVDILISAFRRIRDKHTNVVLKIMGYCPVEELEIYRQLACNDPRIEFVKPGWIEDVGEQLRGCYALVNAARSEAMGRVHLEAMACRKPIVASRTNGAVECVDDGRTGLLCEVEDVDDLAKKLDYVLSNKELARDMGEAGFKRLQTELSEANYIDLFLAMLKEVAGSEQQTGIHFGDRSVSENAQG